MPTTLYLFLKSILNTWGPLWFYMNFIIDFQIFAKNTIVIFIGSALNLEITLGSTDI